MIPLFFGYLWLLPYIYVSMVCFYDYLIGKDNDKVEVEAEVIKTEE